MEGIVIPPWSPELQGRCEAEEGDHVFVSVDFYHWWCTCRRCGFEISTEQNPRGPGIRPKNQEAERG